MRFFLSSLQAAGLLVLLCSGVESKTAGREKPPLKSDSFEDDSGFNITSTDEDYWTQTSYKYNKCNNEQKKALKIAVEDAAEIAFAGLKAIARPGATPINIVDFTERAAIDFFGPEDETVPYRGDIWTTVQRASLAYPGWGWSDWFSNRYVQLSCEQEPGVTTCDAGNVVAFYTPSNKKYGYPLLTFCEPFFSKLKSFDEVLKIVDADADKQVNSASMRSQASTMLHEWIHMTWGVAQICPGEACIDHRVKIGPQNDLVKIYRPGKARMLAQLDANRTAKNNDNFVWFCLTRFMDHRYSQYPVYPLAWDPAKSNEDNLDEESKYPGAPSKSSIEVVADMDTEDMATPEKDAPDFSGTKPYPPSAYPPWYRPMLNASETYLPNVTQPSKNLSSAEIESMTAETATISEHWQSVPTAFEF